MTVAQVATRLGVDRSSVGRYCRHGLSKSGTGKRIHLRGTRGKDGRWSITADEVRRFAKARKAANL